MDYEKLLEKGLEDLPESAIEKQRFDIPKAKGHIEGNKTIISNFNQIAGTMGRKPEHVMKFILKELATPGNLKGGQLVLKSKISASKFNEKVLKYADEFVLCPECGKPDTSLVEEGGSHYLKCAACGTKHQVKSWI